MKRALLLLVLLVGCSSHPPCDEPLSGPTSDDVALIASNVEPANAKLVHFVDFSMGPIHETLQGYMVLRAPSALRLYGMSETGQRAFDVAWVNGKVVRIYRAPFLKDDRVLDLIVDAAQKIFLRRPDVSSKLYSAVPYDRTDEGWELPYDGVKYCWAGPNLDLRWLRGRGYSACFMDWSREDGIYAPRRIHFHSEEGRYPYDLSMKLVKGTVLPAPAHDSMFEAPR